MLLRSPMAFVAQYLAVAPSVAKSTRLQAKKSLGLVEAARDAQEQLRRMGLTMDESAMPRGTDAWVWELDVARVGTGPLRKRQTRWKQPLAEAAIRCEPLKSLAARLTQMGGDENVLWLTANEGPECTALDDLEFRINARIRLDLPCAAKRTMPTSLTAGSQMAQQGPSAWLTWTNTGNMHRNASSEETERSCTMWVATSFTTHVAQRGSNRNGK